MQNKFQNLQNKLQNTVQGLNANITDQANRFKQQIVQNAQSASLIPPSPLPISSSSSQLQTPSSSSHHPDQQQYLRLPVESAKKLRWFDQHDMKMLIQLHLREKHELYQANAVLREELERLNSNTKSNVPLPQQQSSSSSSPTFSPSTLNTTNTTSKATFDINAVNTAVDALKLHDDAVNDVLMASAQAEIERLQEEVTMLRSQLQHCTSNTTHNALDLDRPRNTNQNSKDTINRELILDESSLQIDSRKQRDGDAALHCPPSLTTSMNPLVDTDEETKANEVPSSSPRGQQQERGEKEEEKEEEKERKEEKCSRCCQLEHQVARVSSELSISQQETRSLGAQITQLKSRFAHGEQAQRDLLKIAQDGRLVAEQAREEAEEKILRLQDQCTKLTQHAEIDAKKKVQKTKEEHRQVQELQQQVSILEKRVLRAETAASTSNAELRELEYIALERDQLCARLTATESRLEEYRASSLSSSGMREMLEQSESRRAAAEEELVATAKLAASLEKRLAEATERAERAVLDAQQAQKRSSEAMASIDELIKQRWGDAGVDRRHWPEKAQQEIESVEARLHALQLSLKSIQIELLEALDGKSRAHHDMERAEERARAAEGSVERLILNAELKERRLEAAALAAAHQADELRAALGKMQRERDDLMEEKKRKDGALVAANHAVATAKKQREGGGGLVVPKKSNAGLDGWDIGNGGGGGGDSNSNSDTDLIYLKNILLKYIAAQMEGRYQECEVLLPAVAAVLRASPAEFKALKESLVKATTLFGF